MAKLHTTQNAYAEDYAPFIGAEAVERIRQKAKPLQGLHVTHVNSTY